jgi:hypothetical protein
MNFIILGTGPGLPETARHQSSLYVQVGPKHFLFDCGEGTSRQLIKHGLDGDLIDSVFISHYHPDHVSGLFMLLQTYLIQNRTKPLQVFLPERPAIFLETMQFFYTFTQRLPFQLKLLDCHECELYHEEVLAALNDHLLGYGEFLQEARLPNPMNSYSFRIASPEGDLAFTSDLATIDSVQALVRGCHTVITDAQHPQAGQVLKLQYLDIQRVLLNHGISPELQDKLEEGMPDNFAFAQESIAYTIT